MEQFLMTALALAAYDLLRPQGRKLIHYALWKIHASQVKADIKNKKGGYSNKKMHG